MANPYEAKGKAQFWRPSVVDLPPEKVRPVPAKRFLMPQGARIGTAGSCFAQEVAKVLVNLPDIEFLQTEANAPDQPMFSALYGNIYTVRQLLQLFREAFGLIPQVDFAWQRHDGRWVDASRPTMFAAGFASPSDMAATRVTHLMAVKKLFTQCSIFVLTLGLTEAWLSEAGDLVFPIAPGVMAEDENGRRYKFHNFTYEEILQDLTSFIETLQVENPTVRVILTVSPVPLIATFTDEHVLVATTLSKSILRTVCAAAERKWDHVYYFPSYEIISSHYNSGAYYDPNKRTIARKGVEHVMSVFQESYFASAPEGAAVEGQAPVVAAPNIPAASPPDREAILAAAFQSSGKVICDEELFAKSVGF